MMTTDIFALHASAIEHPYLLDLHGQMDEPMCNKPFSFEYESNIMNHSVLIEELQKVSV